MTNISAGMRLVDSTPCSDPFGTVTGPKGTRIYAGKYKFHRARVLDRAICRCVCAEISSEAVRNAGIIRVEVSNTEASRAEISS